LLKRLELGGKKPCSCGSKSQKALGSGIGLAWNVSGFLLLKEQVFNSRK